MLMRKLHLKKLQIITISLAIIIILQLVVLTLKKSGYGITYSKSQSMPQGWYFVIPAKNLQRNDIVVFLPPKNTRDFLSQKHWGPKSNLLLKHVMGMPGDLVCNRNHYLWINQRKIAPILAFYAKHKRLPQNNFCGKLVNDEYLLLSTKITRSFDGRYFGPVKRTSISGKAVPLFTKFL